MTKDEINQLIIDANGVDDGSETTRAGKFLLAYSHFGPSYNKIARAASMSRFEALSWSKAARRTGVMRNGKIINSDWFDDETGGIAFILDAMTVAGLLQRAGAS